MGKMPEAQNFLIPPRNLEYCSICNRELEQVWIDQPSKRHKKQLVKISVPLFLYTQVYIKRIKVKPFDNVVLY